MRSPPSSALPRRRDEVAVPEPAALRHADLGLVVDMDDAEAHRVAVLPLEVVEQRPRVVALHVDAGGDGAGERLEVTLEVGDARRVVAGAVDDGTVLERR